jgi:enoyl-CoA hydratase
MSDEVLTEVHGRILIVTLNRPESLNAINTEVAKGLLAAAARLDADDSLTIGILTGAGRGFCSGMDLKAFAESGSPEGIEEFMANGSAKPLVAAVEGFAVAGGLELALTCDLLVAARGARLGIPETKVGLFAAGGALLRLPQRLPVGVAMEMALTAEPILAEDAHRYGLVNRLADKGHALEAAIELSERIAKNAPLGVKASKQVIRTSFGRTEAENWEGQAELMPSVFESEDAKEGPKAFAEKREPVWTGR